jgi:hypothetical protein
MFVALGLLLRRRQRRLGPAVFIGVAAAIEIGLGQRLGVAGACAPTWR